MSYSNYQNRKVPSALRYVTDLMRYRHLCWNLVGSDLRSRFRRTRLGILWAVIQPLSYALVIAWAWGAIFKVQSYWEFSVYVFSGILVWDYFSNTVNSSLDGLVNAVGYLRQSRVPFFIFQARVPLSGVVIFYAGLVGLLGMVGVLQLFPPPGLHLLLIPIFPLVLIAFFLPVAVIFSVLGTQFRDLKHIVSIGIQALFFLSPVMMQRFNLDDPKLALLKYANPLVPLIDMFRDPVLHGKMWERADLITVSIWGAALWVLCFVIAVRGGRKLVFAL